MLAVVGMAPKAAISGIEDDGTVTVHAEHQITGLAAMIANRTNPPVSVRVEAVDAGETVVRIAFRRSTGRLPHRTALCTAAFDGRRQA